LKGYFWNDFKSIFLKRANEIEKSGFKGIPAKSESKRMELSDESYEFTKEIL
jgi:hypothetical protein